MKKIILITVFFALAVFCFLSAGAVQTYPSQSGLDAASAITAMHSAVMRDVIGSDYNFSELAGGDDIFVLFTDPDGENYLMISLTDEEASRADMAIIQCYSLKEFETNGMDSLKAIAMPFIPEENYAAFEKWQESACASAADAYRNNLDMELTYYTGEYITCAVSIVHDSPGRTLFTAIVSWNIPLTAEDINAIMEVPTNEN